MKKDTTRFIAEVHARPAIWQLKHPHHKFKNIVKMLWDEVHSQFPEFELSQLKKKWKNLKDTYRKELKKNPQMHTSDPNSTYKSQWHYFHDLDFLKDECRDLIEGEEEEKSNASDSEIQENFADVATAILVSPSDSPTNQLEFSSDYGEVERKRPRLTPRTAPRPNSERKSDDYHFLMSILPEMKKLHPIQKMRLRTKINQALMEEMTLAMYGDPLNLESIQKKEN
ncbi:hypothetical protein ABMA27_007689 [Loxostege sticticalis]|uniref:MADF domain-containing protein n=1 Tax=Loxostege sticticalis TaxID=481309 RepID=A0ABR3HGQ5_LOXSC